MTYYIKVDENNSPVGHPSLEENLKQAFPDHDWSSGPKTGYLEFIHHPPNKGVYQKFDETVGVDISLAYNHNGLEYKLIDGKIQSYWHYIDMTDDEKKELQNSIKSNWAALDPAGPASWTFNETTCKYEAPVAVPSDAWSLENTDGKFYQWDESTTTWKEITE